MCAGCHGVQGEGNPALNAPQIAGLQDWYVTAQLEHFKTGIRGGNPADTYGAQMIGLAAALPDSQTIRNLSAYINSLPATQTKQTLSGNLKNGKELYDHNCSVCHGDNGRGVWSVHAPKLAGMDDWYLARQLRHFRDKVRGAHPEDDLGHQMQLMVSVLGDDQAINDVAVYISGLGYSDPSYVAASKSELNFWNIEEARMAYVPIADRPDEMHDPQSFITKYIWSQDHKVIAIQYGGTAIAIGVVALVLSVLMRLQLGFPDTFAFIDPTDYYQYVTMHGMIMVVYLLTALFLGGFGNYLIPLQIGARDMVFPFLNMLSYWFYLLSVIILAASFFVAGGPTGAGWTLYPPQAITEGTPGAEGGILLMLLSLAVFVVAFTMGGLNYVTTVLQARTHGMTLMRMPLSVWGYLWQRS